MPIRKIPLVTDQFYHIFNRGVAKQPIFREARDYSRFLQTMIYYQFGNPKPKFSEYLRNKHLLKDKTGRIVEIVTYCLMPNHFHLILKQLADHGISEYVRKSTNSYAKYFNTKYERVGSLMQGEFKAVLIDSEEYLLHLSRYVHLNPVKSFVTKNLASYKWSSYHEFIRPNLAGVCTKEIILTNFSAKNTYEQFVLDEEDYLKNLELISHLTLE